MFFQANVSSKKRMNEFNFTPMRLVFVRFLEEIEDTKGISKLTDLYLLEASWLKIVLSETRYYVEWTIARCQHNKQSRVYSLLVDAF